MTVRLIVTADDVFINEDVTFKEDLFKYIIDVKNRDFDNEDVEVKLEVNEVLMIELGKINC